MTQFVSGSLRLSCDPRVGREQRVTLMLNEIGAAPGALSHAYTFASPAAHGMAPGVLDANAITIPFVRVVAGTYVVRLQIDGAESVLEQDGAGLFATPRVVLP